MSENEWLTQFKTIYPESVLFKRANMTLWIQLIGSKSFFFSCNQERNGGGANYSRVLISPTPSRFALHFEAINNSATGLEKYFNNLPWQDFPVAQLRNLMGFFFFRGQQIPAYVWPGMNVTWAQKPSLLIGSDVASKQI